MLLHIKRSARFVVLVFATLHSQISLAGRDDAEGSLPFHFTDRPLSAEGLSSVRTAVDSFLDSLPLEEQKSTSDETVVIEELPVSQLADSEAEHQPEVEIELVEEVLPDEEIVLEEDPPFAEDQALENQDNAAVLEETAIEPLEIQEAVNPAVDMILSSTWVNSGESVTLIWNSQAVSQCRASGHWNGSKTTSGTLSTGPIFEDSSYSLTCEGLEGSALAMATVRVRSATLSWSHPAQNSDGSPLLDLSRYRVYIGNKPGSYDKTLELEADLTQVTVDLLPGHYFFAISGFDSSNNESKLSPEVSKTIH